MQLFQPIAVKFERDKGMFYTEEHYLYFKLFIEELYSEITGIS